MKTKDVIFSHFQELKSQVEKQTNRSLKALRLYNGGE
jgi:hypothetical protein